MAKKLFFMRKIFLVIIIASSVILYSCKKETHCYNCKKQYYVEKWAKGSDTVTLKAIPNSASEPSYLLDSGYAPLSLEIKWTTFYIEVCETYTPSYADSCYALN